MQIKTSAEFGRGLKLFDHEFARCDFFIYCNVNHSIKIRA